jgi:hypothetical protein
VHRSGGAPSSPGGAHDLSSPLPYGSQTTPVSTPRVNPHPRHAWPLPTLLCECPPLSRVLIVNQSLFRMRVVSGPTWPLHEATWDSEPTGWSSTSPQGARTTHHRLRATMAETPTVDPPSPRTLPATSSIFALLSWSHLSSSVLCKSLSLSLSLCVCVCVCVRVSTLSHAQLWDATVATGPTSGHTSEVGPMGRTVVWGTSVSMSDTKATFREFISTFTEEVSRVHSVSFPP